MRIWRKLVESLTRTPRGYSADGRTLGLGLATAIARQDPTADVAEFLRRRAATERQRISS